MSIRGLYKLLFPDAVVVWGVEENKAGRGRRILSNIVTGGFKGGIYPISQTIGEIDGLPTYPELAAVNRPVDMAILCMPLQQVPAAIDACALAGVSGVVIPTRKPEKENATPSILERARATGVRVIGPDAWGVCSPWSALNAGLGQQAVSAGKLAVVSQSAAVCAGILDLSITRRIGLSMLVGLGDAEEVDAADLLDYTANHHRVGAILLHVEQIADMRKFMSAARAASRIKPVVVLKTGRSSSPARPAFTFSGNLIGENAVYDAAFSRAGIVQVSSIERLFDCGDLLSKQPRPRGPNLAIVTNARSPGMMAVDSLREYGLEPAHFSNEILKAIHQVIGSGQDLGNPVTISDEIDADHYGRLIDICLGAKEVDALVIILIARFLRSPEAVARSVGAAVVRKTTPVIAVWMGGNDLEAGRRILDNAGIPTCDSPERAVNAFFNLYVYDQNIRMLQEIPSRLSGRFAVNRARARSIIDGALNSDKRILNGEQALDLLQTYDIPTAPPHIIRPTKQVERSGHKAHDTEIRLASRQLEPFGPVILFGTGGIPSELCTDLSIGLPPLNRLLARRLMEKTRLHRYLCRTSPNSIPLLEELLVNFSHLVVDFPEIVELEVDPMVLYGEQAWACGAIFLIQPAVKRSPMHLVISAYPDEYETTTTTTGGIELFIRPIKPEDAPLLKTLWSTLSPRSLYYRFSRPVTELTPELLARFTQIDYDREIALVALESTGSGDRMLGVSRLMSSPGSDTVEFAIVVGDPWHGRGVGAKLLSRLAVIAAHRGFKTLWGLVLRENRAMIELARKLGWPVIFGTDISEVEVRLDLTTVQIPDVLAAAGEAVSVTNGFGPN